MEWITNNLEAIVAVVTGLITVASVIVKITPNETDNALLAKVIKFFEVLGLNTSPVEKK